MMREHRWGLERQLFISEATAALEAAYGNHERMVAPAVLAAIFDGDGLAAWKTSGGLGVGAGPLTPHTVFRIASLSKSFLAATALRLRDMGELDLDCSIEEYVPGVQFLFENRIVPVSIRQLLTNHSGLPEDNAWGDRKLGSSREEIASLAQAGLLLSAEPGDRYQYSNLGMSFVGRAIEAITGRTVEQEITEGLLVPLSLNNTHFTSDSYSPEAELARGFRSFDGGRSFTQEPYIGSGALACIGGLFSTMENISQWAAFLSSAFSEVPRYPEILAATSRREMQRIHAAVPLSTHALQGRQLETMGYGMGLVVEQNHRFGRIVQHSGSLPGFSAHMRWHLPTGIGVVVLGNSESLEAAQLGTHALASLLERIEAPSQYVKPWPEALAAAKQIDNAIRGGKACVDLPHLFADNVLQDVPAEVRERWLSDALSKLGKISLDQRPLAQRSLADSSPAEMRWVIECARGELRIDIRMIGLRHPLVQSLHISMSERAEQVNGYMN